MRTYATGRKPAGTQKSSHAPSYPSFVSLIGVPSQVFFCHSDLSHSFRHLCLCNLSFRPSLRASPFPRLCIQPISREPKNNFSPQNPPRSGSTIQPQRYPTDSQPSLSRVLSSPAGFQPSPAESDSIPTESNSVPLPSSAQPAFRQEILKKARYSAYFRVFQAILFVLIRVVRVVRGFSIASKHLLCRATSVIFPPLLWIPPRK